jgi:hypothetical protein
MANSPLNLCFGKTAPALPADWEFFSFDENVQLDILTLALILPRILAMFQRIFLHSGSTALAENAFKTHGATDLCDIGELG